MAFTAGFSVNVGDPTKASDVDVLAANDDYLKNAIDTFIANDANNRVLTATGSGTANAESNLTFDGSTLTVTGTVSATTFSGNVTGGTISGTTGTFSGDLAVDTDTLFVDASADRVGIGTLSPGTNASGTFNGLHIEGTATNGELTTLLLRNPDTTFDTAAKVSIEMKPSNSNRRGAKITAFKEGTYIDISQADSGLQLSTVTNDVYVDALTLSASGDMGLGVTPSAKIDIPIPSYDASTTNGMIRFTDPVNSSHANIQSYYVSGAGSGIVVGSNAYVNTSGTWSRWSTSYAGAAVHVRRTGDIKFLTNTSAGVVTERMALTSAGLLGLGTSSPQAMLDTTGVFRSTGGTGVPSTGTGAEFFIDSGVAYFQGYNRTGSAFIETRLRGNPIVLDGGSVGIGTSSPSEKLTIDSGNLRLQGSSGQEFITFVNSSTGGRQWTLANAGASNVHSVNAGTFYIRDSTAGANRLAIDELGAIGIGTDNPDFNTDLHIVNNSVAQIRLTTGTAASTYLTFGDSADVDAGRIIYANATDSMLFYTSGSSAMAIDSSQRVGIGTNSPVVPLHLVTTNSSAASILDAQGSSNACYGQYQNDLDSYLQIGHWGSVRSDTFGGINLSNYAIVRAAGPTNGLIIGTHTPDPVVFATADTERLRITSAGSLGLGTSSPTSFAGYTTLHHKNASGDVVQLAENDNGVIHQIIASGTGTVLTGSRSNHNLQIGTNDTTAITVDTSQRVGIGSSSPSYPLVVSNGGAAGYEFNVSGLNGGVNTVVYNRSTSAYVDSAHFVDNYYIYSGQTPAERFRVESTGVCAFMTPNINIRFNGTATQSVLTNNNGVEIYTGGYIWAGRQAPSLYLNRAGTTGDVAVFYYNSTTSVGSISVTSSATAYNTSSDYRLKENIAPITGAVDRVNALQPRRFNFISDPDTTVDGFVAHEVSSVVPEAITGEKDAVDEEGNPEYQGIDQSKLVPLLTAAIQELTLTTQELTARIEALEAA